MLLESSGIVMLKLCGLGLLGSKRYTGSCFRVQQGCVVALWLISGCVIAVQPQGNTFFFVLWFNFWYFQSFKMDCCSQVGFCCWDSVGLLGRNGVIFGSVRLELFFVGLLQDFSFGLQGIGLGSKTACRIWFQSHCAFGAQWVCVIGLQFI